MLYERLNGNATVLITCKYNYNRFTNVIQRIYNNLINNWISDHQCFHSLSCKKDYLGSSDFLKLLFKSVF